VRVLAVALPALVGAVVAAMLIAPLSPRGEVSFILDRNKADVSEDRPAGRQRDVPRLGQARPAVLALGGRGGPGQRPRADGAAAGPDRAHAVRRGPAVLSAPAGRTTSSSRRSWSTAVSFVAADGYRLTARGVSVSLPDRSLLGQGQVAGSVPAGTFRPTASAPISTRAPSRSRQRPAADGPRPDEAAVSRLFRLRGAV
jgi:lipopolysaccharide export system protein LptC